MRYVQLFRSVTHPLSSCLHPQLHPGPCSGDIDLNLVPDLLVKVFTTPLERYVDKIEVFLSLPIEGGYSHRSRERRIALDLFSVFALDRMLGHLGDTHEQQRPYYGS